MDPALRPHEARRQPGLRAGLLQPLFAEILKEELARPELRDLSAYNRQRFLNRKIQIQQAATGYSDMRRDYSTALIVLMCMVGLVLLIACFNVANLLIARAVARQKEIAVRLAIGASRAQLLRQLLIESLLLSVAGAAAGLLLSVAMIRALLGFLPAGDTPLTLSASPDPRILAFNAALALVTALLFGLVPALQAMRLNLWTTLKDVVGSIAGGGGSVKLRKGLVIAQVALSFLLLGGAGLFVKTLSNLKTTNSGFRGAANLVTFQVDAALNGYDLPRLRAFHQQLLEKIRAIPGVQSAGYNVVPVLAGGEWDSSMSVEGHQAADGEDMQAFMNAVSPGYFQTMGVPLLEGRDFDERDKGGTKARSAIVNRKFATHFFGSRSAIGRHVGFGTGPKSKLDMEIIGVVEDTLYEGPREGVHRQVFLPHLEFDFPAPVTYYARASVGSSRLFSAIRQSVLELDHSMPIFDLKTLENQLDETLTTERLIAMLSLTFGVLATILAAIGLYGVMAFVVVRRTREIGLRMALGAPRGSVVWMILRDSLILLGIGLALGIPVSLGLSHFLSSQLYGVKANDLGVVLAALGILAFVAAIAGLLPARRASTIDPIKALRYE